VAEMLRMGAVGSRGKSVNRTSRCQSPKFTKD